MLLKDANLAIEDAFEKDKQAMEAKYGRRNKMRYIDRLLNELEMLNLADEAQMPTGLRVAVDTLISE
ncbi:MAG: hypothetical protein JOZ15_18425, partial [Acidobacteria bacterium]|nr:hypothetical protein [Acidobacteriota bacterium]